MSNLQKSTVREIPVCTSLSIRYSVTISQHRSLYKKTFGFFRELRFYLYSTTEGKKLGKVWRQAKQVPLKSASKLRKADTSFAEKAHLRTLSEAVILTGINGLLVLNANMTVAKGKDVLDERVEKKATGKAPKRSSTLNTQELFVFWLCNFNKIFEQEHLTSPPDALHNDFARICRTVGCFDLSLLNTTDKSKQTSACNQLAELIRKSMGYAQEVQTTGTSRYGQLVRVVVSNYLRQNGLGIGSTIDTLLRKQLNAKRGTVSKLGRSIRASVLSIKAYRKLYQRLLTDTNPPAYRAELALMLFLGLRPEEVCGLRKIDVVKPPNTNYRALRITMEYCEVGQHDYKLCCCPDSKHIRCVPIPHALNELIKCESSSAATAPLFPDAQGEPQKPEVLLEELKSLLKETPNVVTVNDKGKQLSLDLAFQPKSYRISCRTIWKYVCNLTSGEIEYLSGLTPKDTASMHYIDYNNPHKQYRMYAQLGYGLAFLANETNGVISKKDNTIVFSAGHNFKALMAVTMNRPGKLTVFSRRGVKLSYQGDEQNA